MGLLCSLFFRQKKERKEGRRKERKEAFVGVSSQPRSRGKDSPRRCAPDGRLKLERRSSAMKVTVKTPTGKSGEINFDDETYAEATFGEFREKITEALGIPGVLQRLIKAGKLMDHDASAKLADIGLK